MCSLSWVGWACGGKALAHVESTVRRSNTVSVVSTAVAGIVVAACACACVGVVGVVGVTAGGSRGASWSHLAAAKGAWLL